ncbi:MAG: hypothetical protein ACXADO_01135 [Candidatus Thorarchaeota archaeon]|jgi:hypothetical protein
MISEKVATAFTDLVNPTEGREVDPFMDPQLVRLVAVNLELAVRNLIQSSTPPECLTVTADIGTHRLVAMPTEDGDVKVLVFE